MSARPGPSNGIGDVPGLAVGHATLRGERWLTGCTVVAPVGHPEGMTCGVDVRGGGPGTRETDALDPRNVVERVHAICLAGGSAFGLACADGVMAALADEGIGLPMGAPGEVVPIVPAAVVFDLGRGGDFTRRPGATTGREAYAAARAAHASGGAPVPQGVVGAGTGATAGGLKGGVGTASAVLDDGTTVAALVVVNALGDAVDPATGELYARRFLHPADGVPGVPTAQEARASRERAAQGPGHLLGRPGTATTIGVVATDATLTKARCAKLAGVAHDGLARAVKPVHTMFDGDTFFGAATGERPAPDEIAFHALLDAAADTVTRAIARGVLAATHVQTPAGDWRGYREAFPTACRDLPGDDPTPEPRPGPRPDRRGGQP